VRFCPQRLHEKPRGRLNKIVKILYGTRDSDLCYGYNAFWQDCLEVFDLDASELSGPEAAAMQGGDGFGVVHFDTGDGLVHLSPGRPVGGVP